MYEARDICSTAVNPSKADKVRFTKYFTSKSHRDYLRDDANALYVDKSLHNRTPSYKSTGISNQCSFILAQFGI